MTSKSYLIIILSCFFFLACEKEEDIPCINFPCDGTDDKQINYNRVAYDPAFRIGTWINVRASATSPDTIIFHNNSIWSNFNENGGIHKKKYGFDGLYFLAYTNNLGEEVNPPFRNQTYYNDTTGIYSVLLQQGINGFQQWNHYIKIE